jgi:adenylate cyclase class 2
VIEREIKLVFSSAAEARDALLDAGVEALRARRLQDDVLYDTRDDRLFAERSALRLRRDGERGILTFKGPIEPGLMKTREELESAVDDYASIAALLDRLGFRPWFRYQKYREEFGAPGVVAAVDETPAGVFVEIEGDEAAILALATRLGRGPDDFLLDSYRSVWVKHQDARGEAVGDMIFDK